MQDQPAKAGSQLVSAVMAAWSQTEHELQRRGDLSFPSSGHGTSAIRQATDSRRSKLGKLRHEQTSVVSCWKQLGI